MTDLRKAAQQALDACKLIVSAFDALKPASAARNEPLQINAARASITALEAALAEQLTDEQISDLWHQSGEQPFKFARMISEGRT